MLWRMRWGRVSVAGIVLAAGGIVGWRGWPHDELCDVPKPVPAPSAQTPRRRAGGPVQSAEAASGRGVPAAVQRGPLSRRPAARQLVYEPSVFGDAVILRNEESETYEARRLSDGTLLWRRPFGLEWSTSTVGPAYLYKITRFRATATSRTTGKATTIPLLGGNSLEDYATRGHPNALIAHDRYTLVVFDLPGASGT
jgi:hypothetical protein